LISASAKNSENKWIHGFIKINAERNLKPFKIILNRDSGNPVRFLEEIKKNN
jgi:hypothetical protein